MIFINITVTSYLTVGLYTKYEPNPKTVPGQNIFDKLSLV